VVARHAPVSTTPRIRPEVATKLGYYVYAYVDPRTSEIFYVGKGFRRRALAHLDDNTECKKVERIKELRRSGIEPRIDIIAHALPDEETAFRIEAASIDLLWPGKLLSNKVRGFRSLEFGRASLSELEIIYGAREVRVSEPAILIRINRLYLPGMSAQALYEATRGVWRLGHRRERAEYGFAVFEGVIREVYEIQTWHKAGSTTYETRSPADVSVGGRWEFVGGIASTMARRYCGRSVRHYLPPKSQNPVAYVNC
jgi:hypothetical protein